LNRDDDIFAEALELPPAERKAYLDRVCGHDIILRARIEALLLGHEAAQSFLEEPLAMRPAPLPEEKAGARIGAYTLVRRLGEGGCGVVWLAEQTAPLRRQVALKVIKLGMDTQSVIARFQAERQALALMTHPDIARVYDAGATDAGRPYFVMEYVEGVPITRFCDEHSLAMEARLELFARVCLALQHAHQKGIIHRDLKPSNILVSLRDGVPAPKVIDFGIAKATAGPLTPETVFTELGQFIGTPAYMSPEQAEQRETDLDTRSDVYALGVLLYELLTGRPPYDPKELVRAGLLEIRRIIREVDPPRPSTVISTLAEADRDTVARLRGAAAPRLTAALRGDLDWIVMRCLEKDRDRRYGTAAALAEDVRRHLRQDPVEARPPHALYRLKKFISRNRLACASAAAVTIALVAGTVVSTRQAIRATRAERLAAAERDTAQAAERAEALARADAQRRQEQAEDMLTFMLGDFRAELQKIGRLNLLDAVGEKAMAYFAALDLRDLTDAALTRQAKALTQIGEVRMEQARYAEAEEAFTAAYARAAALVSRHPANGDMLFERGQAEYWIGFVAHRRGDFASGREWYVRYRDTALALSAAEGPTPRARLELSYGHHNLATVEFNAGNLAAAREGFLSARTTLDQMIADRPTDTQLLALRADTSSWLGSIAERDGRFEEASAAFADMHRRYAVLSQLEPKTARWRLETAQSLVFGGQIAALTGRREAASWAYAQAAPLLETLVSGDPTNKHWLSTKLGLQLSQAYLQLTGPETARGESLLLEARRGLEALAADEPTSALFARRLLFAWRLEAGLRLTNGRLDEAESSIARAVAIAEPLLQGLGEARAEIWVRHDCAHAQLLAGQIAEARQKTGTAHEFWTKALATLGANPAESNDWRLLEPAALAFALAGHHESARSIFSRLQTFGYVSLDPRYTTILTRAGSPSPETKTNQEPEKP
jgi:eukaryotic-like serine/threonine-protein kinase